MRFEYKLFRSERPFGVELECSNTIGKTEIQAAIKEVSEKPVHITRYAQSLNNDYWHVKEDSSCGPRAHLGRDYGVELASYKGSGLSDILHIANVADHLRTIGVETNPNCGFHIHAEIRDFNQRQAGILLARWLKIERLMCLMVPAHRVNNKHCKQWLKHKKIALEEKYDPQSFWEIMRPSNFDPYENPDKRVTLNFVNFAYSLYVESVGSTAPRKTVEFRLPEGTLSKHDISNWVKLYLMFIDASSKAEMPNDLLPVDLDEFLTYLGFGGGGDSFSFLSYGLHDLKKWILQRILNSQSASGDKKSAKYWRDANEKLLQMVRPKKMEKSGLIPCF